jgi:hypothetical protein
MEVRANLAVYKGHQLPGMRRAVAAVDCLPLPAWLAVRLPAAVACNRAARCSKPPPLLPAHPPTRPPALPSRVCLLAVWDVSSCPYFSPYYFSSCGADRTARLWSTDRVQPLRLFVGGWLGGRLDALTARSCSTAMLRFLVPLPFAVGQSRASLPAAHPSSGVCTNPCRCLQATRQMWMW